MVPIMPAKLTSLPPTVTSLDAMMDNCDLLRPSPVIHGYVSITTIHHQTYMSDT